MTTKQKNDPIMEWIQQAVQQLQMLDPKHDLLKFATGENPEQYEAEAISLFNPNDDPDVRIPVEYLAAVEDAIQDLRESQTADAETSEKEAANA